MRDELEFCERDEVCGCDFGCVRAWERGCVCGCVRGFGSVFWVEFQRDEFFSLGFGGDGFFWAVPFRP